MILVSFFLSRCVLSYNPYSNQRVFASDMSHLTLYRSITPRNVMGDFSTSDIKITSDIDSLLISCTSLEPYYSKLRFQFLTGDVKTTVPKILNSQNISQNRHELFPNLLRNNSDESFLVIQSESMNPNEDFNKFELGYIDNIPIYCVY